MDGGGGDADGCGGLSYELNVMLWFPRRSQHMTMTMTMTIILILILINISININININIIINININICVYKVGLFNHQGHIRCIKIH